MTHRNLTQRTLTHGTLIYFTLNCYTLDTQDFDTLTHTDTLTHQTQTYRTLTLTHRTLIYFTLKYYTLDTEDFDTLNSYTLNYDTLVNISMWFSMASRLSKITDLITVEAARPRPLSDRLLWITNET